MKIIRCILGIENLPLLKQLPSNLATAEAHIITAQLLNLAEILALVK